MPVVFNSFKQIKVIDNTPQQPNIETIISADDRSDTLTLKAGIGISLVPTPSGDFIEIINTGAPTGVANLDDVVEVGGFTTRTVEVGELIVDRLTLDQNSLTTNLGYNLNLSVSGSGVVVVDTNTALQIPSGADATRPTGSKLAIGQIRFNTEKVQFEGFDGANWNTLGGVQSVDGGTTIKPETDASLPVLNFYASNSIVAQFSAVNNKFLSRGLQIPVGTSAERPFVLELGQIRFNSETTQFEGYNGTGWSSLGGVRDIDGNTFIIPETEPGTNENRLYMYTNDDLALTVDGDKVAIYNGRELQFRENINSGQEYASIVAPSNITSSYTLKLPTHGGSAGNLLGLGPDGQLEFVNSDAFAGGRVVVSAEYGSDTNDGINKPVKTLKRALQIASGLVYDASFVYNEAACRRDAELLIDSMAWDLVTGSNWRTVKAALSYYNATASLVLTDQKTQTINSIKFLKSKLLEELDTASRITVGDLTDVVINVITNGTSVAPAVTMPVDIVTGEDAEFVKAKNILLSNVAFASAEVIAWINSQIANNIAPFRSSFEYDESVCQRDTGLILNAVGYDVALNTNYNAVTAGLAYQRSSSSYLQSSQKTQTIAAINYVKSTVLGLSAFTASPNASQRAASAFEEIIDILQYGALGTNNSADPLVFTDPVDVSANLVNAKNQLINNKVFIQEEIKFWIAANYKTLVYNDVAFARNVGHIVDALCYDILYGGNSASVGAAQSYFSNGALQIPADQRLMTVNAYDRLSTIVQQIVQGTTVTRSKNNESTQNVTGPFATLTEANVLSNLIQITVDAINDNSVNNLPATVNPSIIWAAQEYQTAQAAIVSNTESIKTSVITYINANNPFTYNSAKCARDTEYIVKSIAYDLVYGGNSQTVDAGLKYYNGITGAEIIPGQKHQTVAALNRLKTVLTQVIVGTPVDATTGNTATQVIPPAIDLSGPNAQGSIVSKIGIISSIITYGVSAAPAIVNPTVGLDAVRDANKTTMLAVSERIADNVVAYASDYKPNGKKVVINVGAGNYIEDNPVIIPDNVSVLGASLRACDIRPLNPNKDMFRLRNGAYFGEFTFRDYVDPDGVPTHTWDYATAFDDVRDKTTSRLGYEKLPISKPVISVSPYIQNVSIISFLGGNGAKVDGNLVQTPNVPDIQLLTENPVSGPAPEQGKSFVANAFTMLSFGGTGWRIINDAYAQIVSCFQIFMLNGSYCQSGGYLSITNSATNFGLYALRSSGYSPNAFTFDKGYITSSGTANSKQTLSVIGFGRAPTQDYVIRFRNPNQKVAYDLLKASKDQIQTDTITWINQQKAGNIAPFTSSFTYDQALCRRDVGLIIDAVAIDVYTGGNSKSVEVGLSQTEVSKIMNDQLLETIAAINYVKGRCQTVVTSTGLSSYVAEKFDIITGILQSPSTAPESYAFSSYGDITNDYKPASTEFSFDANSAVDPTNNVIKVVGHGLLNGTAIIYETNNHPEIPGLNSEQTYYVKYLNADEFGLYFDSSSTLEVDIRSKGTGTHKFIKNLQEFFVNEVTETHNSYQELTLQPGTYNFVPGYEITGTTGSAGNNAYVYSYDPVTYKLIVSLNKVIVGSSAVRNPFDETSFIVTVNGQNTNIDVVSVAAINNIYSATFAILSTTTGGLLTNLNGLVGKQIWLHRPSIVNSSGHTWEYAGSGTDYNALPQNGGKSKYEYEQFADLPGRVYTSGTNELGDFKVGNFIKAENRTGNVSFTNKVSVAQLDALRLAVGDIVIELISNDIDLGDNEPGGASDSRLSTQKAIRSFMSNRLGSFIDKSVSTNAVPGAVIQLNSSGQINPDLLPAVRTFNSAKTYGYLSRLTLLEEVPAYDFLNGDIVTEEYSTVQLTLSAPITASQGTLVVQATTDAQGYIISDVFGDSVITVASKVVGNTTGAAFNTTFNTVNDLTIGGDATPSTTNTTVRPTLIGTYSSNVNANYVLTNSNEGQYLKLLPSQSYSFTVGSYVTSTNDNIQGVVTSTRYGVLTTVDNAGLTQGTNYTPLSGSETYRLVPLTNVTGTGTGAYADITVTNGKIASVDLRRGGTGYAVGNRLSASAANLGGTGSGFEIAVTSIEQRLYVSLIGGEKFVATLSSPNFLADNNAPVKTITNTSATSKTFNAQSTTLGGSVDYVTNRITITSHEFGNGDPVKYVTPGVAIGGLSNNEVFYVKAIDVNTIELYNDYSLLDIVEFSSSATGTHSLTTYAYNLVDNSVYVAAHGWSTGDAVRLTGADLPQVAGVKIISGSFFFIGSVTTNSFTLHASRTEALASANGLVNNRIVFTTTGSGPSTFTKQNVIVQGVVNTSSQNVANWSPLSVTTINASSIVGGVISTSRLAGAGVANDATFLRGDSTWATAVQRIYESESPITLTGSFETVNGKDYYYNDVLIDIERVDGNAGDGVYTNLGVAKFLKSQFAVGTTTAKGEVYIKDGVIDAGTLDGLDSSYYLNPANLTSNVPVNKGGTNLSSYAEGDMLYASGTSNLSKVSIGAVNTILTSDSAKPVWSSSLTVPNNVTILGTTNSTSTTTGSLSVAGGVGIAKNLNVGANLAIGGDLSVAGNVNISGTITTVNSTTVNIDDKNIELGAVAAISNLSGTISGNTISGLASTAGLTQGMKLVKTTGTGAFGANPTINTVVNASTITVSVTSGANTDGTIVFDISGATNSTADGGGITLLGTTDKTFNWVNATSAWTSSEHLNLAAGKEYRINGIKVLDSTSLGSGVQSIGTITTGVWNATIINPTYGGTGVNNGSKTITLGGNLTTSGAFNTTLTATADTSVTLPTTGTLATLANTETLSNKTLVTPKILDSGADHTYNFAVSNLAANRTVSLPSLSGDDTFVFAAQSQTLSSKTLTTPKINDASENNTYNFAVSELAADRTITLPLLTGNDTFVFEAHTQSLSNKTLVTPKIADSAGNNSYNFVVSDLAADRNVILPLLTGNDTFVFQSHTQTLTNKTLTDASTYFQDEADNTKKMQFQLSGISTGTTRTLTIPDQSGTISVVGDSFYIGTTQIANNRTSAAQTLAGINGITSESGLTLQAPDQASGNVAGLDVALKSGAGAGSGKGGDLAITSGAATATNSSRAGNITITGGNSASTTAAGNGGSITLQAGNVTGTGGGKGAFINLYGGAAVIGSGGQARIGSGDSVGTDIAGSTTFIFGGKGTGAGVGGSIDFYTSPALASGTATQTATSRLEILNTGQVKVKANITSTSTTTGSLVVTGGVGISENVWVGGTLKVSGNNVVTVGDSGTVTNTMLAGSIANSKLTNSSITVGSTAISLGNSSTTLAGLTSVTSTGFTGDITGRLTYTVTGTNSAELVRGNMGDNDQARILIGATGSNAGYLEIATADDGTEPIYVRQYTGVFTTLTRTATLLDASGNTSFPGTVNAAYTGYVYGTNGTSYSNAFQVREAGLLLDTQGHTDTEAGIRPRLGFHWGGVVASSIALRQDGHFQLDDNPGTGRANLYAGTIYSNGNAVLTSYTDTNTTYSISAGDGVDASEKTVVLTAGGSGSGDDKVTFKAGTNVTLSRDGDVITINSSYVDTDTDTITAIGAGNPASTFVTGNVSITGGGATTVSRSGNTITISSTDTDTDTWRPIHDAPVNGSTTTSISSNWAYDHAASGTAHGATSANTASTIVMRDANKYIYADVFSGTATKAQYADLAENYLADAEYEEGTVLIIGGTLEVTISTSTHSPEIAGVVSTNPAHLMNAELEGEFVVAVALQGRVPVKVTGKIKKGDRLVASSIPGLACAYDKALYEPGCIIGKAMEDFDGESGVIEIVVGRV